MAIIRLLCYAIYSGFNMTWKHTKLINNAETRDTVIYETFKGELERNNEKVC